MLRWLFVTHGSPWPCHGGAAVRVWSLMRALSEGGDRVELITHAETGWIPPEPLLQVCSQVTGIPSPLARSDVGRLVRYLGGQFRSEPWMVREWVSPALSKAVSARGREADAVVAVLLGMAPALDAAPAGVLRVYDAHNVEWQILAQVAGRAPSPLRRFHARREAARVRTYEGKVARAADRVVCVTEADRQELLRLSPGACLSTVPIAVVADEYRCLWRPGRPRLCFPGDMGWGPNEEGAAFLVREVLPKLRQLLGEESPETVLAGRRPTALVSSLAGPDVRVTGFVPSMEDVLAGDTIVVVPLLTGSGMRVKILEAMAWGLPVVSTPLGCAGIEHGGALMEAGDPEQFARALADLLRVQDRRRSLGEAGRRLVAARFDYRQSGHRFREIVSGPVAR